VYLAGLDHFLYKLDSRDGTLIWERELSGALADEPASFDGLLLVGTFGEELVAVDKQSGQVAWAVETGDWVWGNPGVADDMAYFGDVAGAFYAVNQSGSTIWDFNVDGQIAASPVLDEENVYFVTQDGSVFARTASDNSPQWEQSVEGRLLSDPALVDGKLIVAAVEGENLLTTFDVTSGAILWTYQPVEE
jgi:outer membrane protein assembly factor BamB